MHGSTPPHTQTWLLRQVSASTKTCFSSSSYYRDRRSMSRVLVRVAGLEPALYKPRGWCVCLSATTRTSHFADMPMSFPVWKINSSISETEGFAIHCWC